MFSFGGSGGCCGALQGLAILTTKIPANDVVAPAEVHVRQGGACHRVDQLRLPAMAAGGQLQRELSSTSGCSATRRSRAPSEGSSPTTTLSGAQLWTSTRSTRRTGAALTTSRVVSTSPRWWQWRPEWRPSCPDFCTRHLSRRTTVPGSQLLGRRRRLLSTLRTRERCKQNPSTIYKTYKFISKTPQAHLVPYLHMQIYTSVYVSIFYIC